jgi:hypothetical protein
MTQSRELTILLFVYGLFHDIVNSSDCGIWERSYRCVNELDVLWSDFIRA